MSKSISAIILFLVGTDASKSRKPLLIVHSLSDMEPQFSLLTNVDVPFGAIPIRPFFVEWLLQAE